MVGKLLKDVIIAGVVCFQQVASSNIAAKSESVKLALYGRGRNDVRNEGLPVN